jgi:hypothetical protein
LADIIEGNTNTTPTYSLENNQWRQISLPCDPGTNETVAKIFGDDGLGDYGTNWRIWAFDAATNSYREVGINGSLERNYSAKNI